jgi:hypothetical protein
MMELRILSYGMIGVLVCGLVATAIGSAGALIGA